MSSDNLRDILCGLASGVCPPAVSRMPVGTYVTQYQGGTIRVRVTQQEGGDKRVFVYENFGLRDIYHVKGSSK